VAIAAAASISCRNAEQVPDEQVKVPITTSSEEARLAYLEGRGLQERLRPADARPRFLVAVDADPAFALAHLGVATTAPTNQEFFAAARRAMELAQSASDGERLQVEAFMAGVNGEPERQLALLQRLEGAFKDDERVQQQLGTYHFFTRQDYAAAVHHLERAIEIEPTFSPAYNLLGYARRFLGDFEGAEQAFRRYTELIDDEPNPYDSYAELLMKMGRFEDSISNYRKALEIDPTFVNAYVGIANDLMFQGDCPAARAVLDELRTVAANDGQRRLACTWAAASYLHEGDYDGAIAEVRRRAEIAAATDDFGALAQDRNFEGDILLAAGRPGDAERAYVDCVDMVEKSQATDEVKETVRRNSLYDLARAAVVRGDLERAVELTDAYRERVAVHQIPAETWQVAELEGLIAAAEGDWYGATKSFASGNQQDPRVVFAMAQALSAAGQDSSAHATCLDVVGYNQLNVNYGYVRRAALDMCGSR
jgi:tetratricopeptide (TPR) repeat protein